MVGAVVLSLITTRVMLSQPSDPPSVSSGDGQHDFDFNLGTWKTHVSRLQHPLTGSADWVEYDGNSVVSKIWAGRANLFELEVDGAAGHIEGAGLRLYNPQSHQWSLNWVSIVDGQLQPPMIGQFANGRGEFVDHEVINGKSVLTRNTFSEISANFARFEQALSADGGKSWEATWVMTFSRAADAATGSPAGPPSKASASPTPGAALPEHDGQHDFDFAFGTWKTHIKRLKGPLTGSTSWVEYDGTHTIRKVWGGRANLGELEADGPEGHIEALSPRFFSPLEKLWRVCYGNPRDGSLSRPLAGQFKNGRGEFYGQDTLRGKTILVREFYTPIDAKTRKLEVAFSADGGANWETNWIMTDTLVGAAVPGTTN